MWLLALDDSPTAVGPHARQAGFVERADFNIIGLDIAKLDVNSLHAAGEVEQHPRSESGTYKVPRPEASESAISRTRNIQRAKKA